MKKIFPPSDYCESQRQTFVLVLHMLHQRYYDLCFFFEKYPTSVSHWLLSGSFVMLDEIFEDFVSPFF